MLPNDINMLVSYINTKLRDDDMSLVHLLEINDVSIDDMMLRLEENNFTFDETINQIKAKQTILLDLSILFKQYFILL